MSVEGGPVSKPFVLHTYPIWESLGGALYADIPGERFPRNVGYEVHRKRLTEPELAAILHDNRAEHAQALYEDLHERYIVQEGREETPEEEAAHEKASIGRLACGNRTEILHRLASNPHHDDIDDPLTEGPTA